MSHSFRTFKVHLWPFSDYLFAIYTVKPVLNGHSKEDQLVFKTDYHLIQVKSIAECSILQYFQTALSYHLQLRHFFLLFLSGRF